MTIGPKLSLKKSCRDCDYCISASYQCQGDSGHDVKCKAVDKFIGDTTWDTPDWCPYLKEAIDKFAKDISK